MLRPLRPGGERRLRGWRPCSCRGHAQQGRAHRRRIQKRQCSCLQLLQGFGVPRRQTVRCSRGRRRRRTGEHAGVLELTRAGRRLQRNCRPAQRGAAPERSVQCGSGPAAALRPGAGWCGRGRKWLSRTLFSSWVGGRAAGQHKVHRLLGGVASKVGAARLAGLHGSSVHSRVTGCGREGLAVGVRR